MKQLILEFLNTILFVLTVLGTNLLDTFQIHIGQTEKILVSVLLVVFYLIVVWKKEYTRTHSFQEGTKRFFRYFATWYSNPGELTIFCTDLEWLQDKRANQVVEALKKKKDKLHLYLRTSKDPVATDLISYGANIHIVKPDTATSHRFSILDNDGIQSILIRNRDISTDKIVFVETHSQRDPYLISLTKDFLEDCYDD